MRLHEAREVIGKPGLQWHDLRRTAATLGAQAGATVREMQSRLGHSTPTMALDLQGATAEQDRRIADLLQEEVQAAQAAGATHGSQPTRKGRLVRSSLQKSLMYTCSQSATTTRGCSL